MTENNGLIIPTGPDGFEEVTAIQDLFKQVNCWEFFLKFTTQTLGTTGFDQQAYQDYIVPQGEDLLAPDAPNLSEEDVAAELATLPEAPEDPREARGWTGFRRFPPGLKLPVGPGYPEELQRYSQVLVASDYSIKGFMKEAIANQRLAQAKTKVTSIKAYKKWVNGTLFIQPRWIPFLGSQMDVGLNERPLRTQTQQGERVAIARSEELPPGAYIRFFLLALGTLTTEEMVNEIFAYGRFSGLLQWRSGSFLL